VNRIFDWPPIIWTVRIGLLIVLTGGLHVFVLLISRFFRWTNIRNMVLADPPRVESVGGEFAGAKAELKLFQHAHSSLDERVANLETRMDRVMAAMDARDPARRGGDE
jgi:hypothetical protein